MRKNVTPELLAKCLADIEDGRATIEECMAAYPDMAEELRSLLEIAQAIAPPPYAGPDPAFRMRSRATLVAAISADKNPVTKWSLSRLYTQITAGWGRPPQLRLGRMGMPALIIALIVALTAAGGGGAVYASQDALPGDALYQVKTTVESVQLSLAASDEAKAQAYLGLAAKRAAEVQKASQKGNTAAAATAAEAVVEAIAQADQHLTQGSESDQEIGALIAEFAENLARQQQILAAVQEHAPDQAKSALAKAAKMAEKSLEHASARLEQASKGGRGKGPWASATPTVSPTVTATITSTQVSVNTPLTTTITLSNTVPITLTQMISNVTELSSDPEISGQSENGLLAKLNAAQAAIERGQPKVAANVLNAFFNQLNAFNQSGHISPENYAGLLELYNDLIGSLESLAEEANSLAKPGRSGSHPGQLDLTPEPTETSDNDHGRSGSAKGKGPVGAEDERGRGNGRKAEDSTLSPTPTPRTGPGSSRGPRDR